MKTLADIKRRIKPGVIIECVSNTHRPELNGQLRRVAQVQGNAFTWRLLGAPETEPRNWTHYPPAKSVTVCDADTFVMALTNPWGVADRAHTVTLRFAGPNQPGSGQ